MNRIPREVWLGAVLVGMLSVWWFWPATHNGLVKWDDDVYLSQAGKHAENFWQGIGWAFTAVIPLYYQPLTWLTHLVDARLWGNGLAGPHAVNLLWHGVNAGLVVLLSWSLAGIPASVREGEQWVLAIGVGLVFALHPLQVESVAWLAERKNLLCGFFCLLALLAYVWRCRDNPDAQPSWLVTGFVFAALLSKPMAVSLPVVMLALDVHPLNRVSRVGWKRLLTEKAVLIGLCAAVSVVTIIGQAQIGAVQSLESHSGAARVVVAIRAVLFYCLKFFWPAWLSPFYPRSTGVSMASRGFVVPLLLFVVVTAGALAWRKQWPVMLVAWVAFLGWLAPIAGLVQVGSQGAADRFMYLALLPLALAMGALVIWVGRQSGRIGRGLVGLVAIGGMLFFGTRTSAMIPVWRDEETLWHQVLMYYPNSGIANFHYAMALTERRRLTEALPYAAYAATEIPDNALARSVAGLLWLKNGHAPEAERESRAAIDLNPKLWGARYNLACALSRLGRYDEAWHFLQDVIQHQPQFRDTAQHDPELSALREQPGIERQLARQ